MVHAAFFLLVFMLFVFSIVLVYFFIFTRNQEKFVHYWGISWIFYLASLTLVILDLNSSLSWLQNIRIILDLLSTLFLMFGAYTLMHISIPNYWLKFTLYLIIWIIIGILYGIDNIVILIPVSIYQLLLCTLLCIIIYKYWNSEKFEKSITIIIFMLWGVSKSIFSFLAFKYQNPSFFKMIDIILSNIINFCILLVYLRKIRNELTQTKKQFQTIAENVTDIIFGYQLKPFSCFSYVSPSVEKITGYSQQDFYNNPRLHIEIAHKDDLENAQSLFTQKHDKTTKVLKWYHKDGNIIWVEFHNSMVFENDKIAKIEGIIIDITRKKAAEDELIQSKKSQQLLFSYVSHELRTPITSILGYISAIRDGTFDSQEKVNSAVDLIYSKVITLQRLINDLFQLSQLETKQFSFNFMQISIHELFDHIVSKYALDIENAGINFVPINNENRTLAREIIADPQRMEQVFSNIFFNAIKYTHKKGTITFLCKCDIPNNVVIFSISDTGEGIPEKDIKKIFNRFYKSNQSQAINGVSGSGLGLSIAKEIVDAHGGNISVESTMGVGSTFNISLPLYLEL